MMIGVSDLFKNAKGGKAFRVPALGTLPNGILNNHGLSSAALVIPSGAGKFSFINEFVHVLSPLLTNLI